MSIKLSNIHGATLDILRSGLPIGWHTELHSVNLQTKVCSSIWIEGHGYYIHIALFKDKGWRVDNVGFPTDEPKNRQWINTFRDLLDALDTTPLSSLLPIIHIYLETITKGNIA